MDFSNNVKNSWMAKTETHVFHIMGKVQLPIAGFRYFATHCPIALHTAGTGPLVDRSAIMRMLFAKVEIGHFETVEAAMEACENAARIL